jgi:hypothetical protein
MVLLVEKSSDGFPKFPNFKSRLRRFRSVVRGEIVQWEPQGLPYFLSNELAGPPMFIDDAVCVAETDNTINFLSLDNENARPHKTKLKEEITTEPFNRGRFVFAVEGERWLSCLVPDQGEQWRFGPFFGDIAGKPVMRDGVLIVADRSGRVTAVRPEDGQQVWQVNLGRGKNPSAAAVPYGDDRILVPLTDGSFIEFPVPREETDATDQEAA